MLDVSDPAAVQAAVGGVAERRGHIHVLVNCAAIAPMVGVLDITPEQWQRVIDINLNGYFYMSQAAARNMVEHGGGVIVNISSCNSFIVESPYADYNAAKGGVNLLTQSMAFELAHRGVRCVAVAPGMTMTPMMDFTNDQETYRSYMEKIPMRRPALPRDQANVVLFLASDDAAYVTGITIRVDGGIMQGFWADPRMAPPAVPGAVGEHVTGARPGWDRTRGRRGDGRTYDAAHARLSAAAGRGACAPTRCTPTRPPRSGSCSTCARSSRTADVAARRGVGGRSSRRSSTPSISTTSATPTGRRRHLDVRRDARRAPTTDGILVLPRRAGRLRALLRQPDGRRRRTSATRSPSRSPRAWPPISSSAGTRPGRPRHRRTCRSSRAAPTAMRPCVTCST